MSRGSLWEISVGTTSEAEAAVRTTLETWLEQPACSYTDAESGRTTVSLYFDRKPDWRAIRTKLEGALERIRRSGLEIRPGGVRLKRVRAETWALSWRRHFKPLEIGSQLLVRPSWSRRRPRRHQALVVLDPGLSFGTGQHPTTEFCLHELVRRRQPGRSQSFLDVGTGSGILAIAAAKLGYAPVEAWDLDPEAVRIAQRNARSNRVGKAIVFRRRDLSRLAVPSRKKYSLVCANLVSNVLISERRRIVARLAPGSLLVLAGILREEFGAVQRVYEAEGLRLVVSRARREWRSGTFRNLSGKNSDPRAKIF